MESWHHVYVCMYLPWFRHLYVHTFRMCIDVGIGHEQREHFESVCTYPASVKVEWCGQAGWYVPAHSKKLN